MIERVTFHNVETSLAILQVKIRGQVDLVPVLGTLPEVTAGEWLDAQGHLVSGIRSMVGIIVVKKVMP